LALQVFFVGLKLVQPQELTRRVEVLSNRFAACFVDRRYHGCAFLGDHRQKAIRLEVDLI
jgi:hypothetical protein